MLLEKCTIYLIYDICLMKLNASNNNNNELMNNKPYHYSKNLPTCAPSRLEPPTYHILGRQG